MRFIPINCLRSDQVLASDLVMDNHRIILRRGVSLTTNMISRIKQMGFQGVYIDDDLSRDIEITNIISDELRFNAKKEVRSLFVSIEDNNYSKANKKVDTIEKLVNDIVDEVLGNRNVMANMMDLRTFDDYTFSHCVNVSVLSTLIGTTMGMKRSDLQELALGALIHDIGKVFIDKSTINKVEKLTRSEFEEIKRHAQYGYEHMASNKKIPEDAKKAILMHHEQFNGNGYPSGIAGNDIHIYGRTICVADVYDALTSDRPYRKALLPSDAVEYIMSGYNTMFDPDIVDSFTKRVSPYPVGTCVKLSTGETAIVTQNFMASGLRPKVKLIRDSQLTNEEIDLSHDRRALNITIQQIVNL